ncbi:MAG TPA: hypothetical protein VFA18_07165, partial [Gemmataceae bacterium]|nr:hypothetical protein [Gemmataceae bacterium]
VWWQAHNHPAWHGLVGMARQLLRAGHVLSVLFLPIGLWWYRKQMKTYPQAWLLLVTAGLQGLVVWCVGVRLGYATERHMLLILMCLLFWAVAALLELPACLRAQSAGPYWSTVLLLVVLATCLPRSLQPLHAERLGHRAAGRWLAEHAGPADVIVDPFSWSYYYSGRLFDGAPRQRVPEAGQPCYVVMDCAKDLHGQVDDVEQVARALLPHGKLVFDWRPAVGSHGRASEIQVYFVPSAGTVVR